MIGNLFALRYVAVQSEDWSSKKEQLKEFLRDEEFERYSLAQFDTDRHSNNNRYLEDFANLFGPEIDSFALNLGLKQVRIDSIWAVRYGLNDYHAVHNHRSKGYSGILYVDYDPSVHTPSIHVAPWNDPVSDQTVNSAPEVSEGTFVFVPSSVLHYTFPNTSIKLRQVVAFDMEVQ